MRIISNVLAEHQLGSYGEDLNSVGDDLLAGGLRSTSWAISDGGCAAGDGVD